MKSLFFKITSIFILGYFLSIQAMQGQALGAWTSYMAYQKATMVAAADNGFIYAVYTGYPLGESANINTAVTSDGSLMRYDPRNGEIKKIFKADGLNDVHIARIAYMESEKILVIIYTNGNIDLYDTNTDNGSKRVDIYNISDFMNKTEQYPDKTVNDIVFDGSFAYICMNYGIIALDIKTKTMKETFRINKKINSMCIWGDYYYAATEEGIKRARKDAYLSAASSWEPYNLSYPKGNASLIKNLLTYKGNLIFYQPTIGVFYMASNESSPVALSNAPVNLNQITILNGQLVLLDNTGMFYYSDLNFEKKFSSSNILSVSSVNSSDIYWLARGYEGIFSIYKSTNVIKDAQIVVNSPRRNLNYNMKHVQGKLFVVGGGMYTNNYKNAGTLMILENNNWYNLDHIEVQGKTKIPCRDLSDIAIDPQDKDHYFVTSIGEGLYEFRSDPNTKKINFEYLYTEENTSGALKSIIANSNRYIRLGTLAFDNKNDLYIVAIYEQRIENPIIIRSTSGEWTNLSNSIPKPPNPTRLFNSLIVTRDNQKWVAATRPDDSGIYVFDDSENVSRFSNSFKDQDGNNIEPTFFNCIVEDLNGTIWVGTSVGPIVFYNPGNITKPENTEFRTCSRIKVPRYDGTDDADFLLDEINVSSIAIDGANRKWIGTNGEGVFLVSATGEEVIANYTTENSPLISNNIIRIAINNDNGEVFIGTDKGLVSYMSDASGGKTEYSNVYAYPNPVKPDFVGDVVITGLIKDSNVKITDLSGNTMYQGTSIGGQFTWNCKNRAGERVKTGVYLVFAATSDGTQGIVSKIVVIK